MTAANRYSVTFDAPEEVADLTQGGITIRPETLAVYRYELAGQVRFHAQVQGYTIRKRDGELSRTRRIVAYRGEEGSALVGPIQDAPQWVRDAWDAAVAFLGGDR